MMNEEVREEAAPAAEPPITVTMKRPFELEGQRYEEVVFKRRPKARDMVLLPRILVQDSTQKEREQHMIATLCEIPTETLDAMDLADYVQLQGVWSGFFSQRPKKQDG
uniref:Phage tail assembly chaperone protein, E, or 41 or 14 n=1 Tax=Candidatus Kentrum sp. TC TaxID=2126339 RepID=A0A450ZAK9_9GAMM|nr:MAG: Phage tail assembly chaperone protein, E, or 41 or 14 [Candidatus Kentron sp. TC]VFK50698.1 MAG: Phage tail assembly chaperone protein, E, or 41 or 14 [Candidatus Kentron sp. TC]VFK59845.1 MAG: Phage tail assembly chaperone protein, E, or 41 or 14 [Candidatus Kentron sp. TC]